MTKRKRGANLSVKPACHAASPPRPDNPPPFGGIPMSVRLGIVMDPIARINFKKDSSLAMLLAAQARDWVAARR